MQSSKMIPWIPGQQPYHKHQAASHFIRFQEVSPYRGQDGMSGWSYYWVSPVETLRKCFFFFADLNVLLLGQPSRSSQEMLFFADLNVLDKRVWSRSKTFFFFNCSCNLRGLGTFYLSSVSLWHAIFSTPVFYSSFLFGASVWSLSCLVNPW